MSLDLPATMRQLEAVAERLRQGLAEYMARLDALAAFARTLPLEALRRAAQESPRRLPFLPAEPLDPLPSAYDPPSLPYPWRALATDGSHIDLNRHLPLRCYLINIGRVAITYGAEEPPLLESTPHLFADSADLHLYDIATRKTIVVEGALVTLYRSGLEVQALASLVQRCTPPYPTVGLVDGSLVLWAPEGGQWPEVVRQRFVRAVFLQGLETLRLQAGRFPLAVGGYISLPNSAEVINTLRLALCTSPPGECPSLVAPEREPTCPCAVARGFTDRDLFRRLLEPGQRSGLFRSLSVLVREEYGANQAIYFFYLHAGPEVVRVEMPAWCARQPMLVGLLHASLLEQVRRGDGYPLVLQEAHEQAVISSADREAFRLLVEESLAQRHLPVYTSEKQRSKRLRSL
ncbi:MAG: DNA double-strand break repair nuclease NurA [Dehalococcoidia bacterium]|nr:DNA double-strand break repair nuclease NurA [Dehalococcoidia bacterium]MDW8119285.1 DNA double-strand break repair nuclease NurA [Chloroflexota bacterium]